MVVIKDAAVPHYSKYNGKIVFAVRVCPANLGLEPYTVYRRWDEFLDLSAKLANVFPSASPDPSDPSAIFRRIPRLSRKVTLFPTSSTHSNRRDELDLFVRHLVNLPKAVTSFPLVRDFFTVKMNGLDGRQPPSPTASPSLNSTSQFSSEGSYRFDQTSTHSTYSTTERKGAEQNATPSQSQTLKKKSSKQLLQPAQIHSQPQIQSLGRSFRPTLTAKRSTPDLRRFMAASSLSHSSEEEPPVPSPSAAVIYPTLDKFSFPPRRAPDCPPTPGPTSSPAGLSSPAASIRSPRKRPSARPSSRDGYISSLVSASDNMSTRTTSTVRPGRAGSSSRMASPMSFVSVTSEDSGRETPMPTFPLPPTTPRNGRSSKTSVGAAPSLRHFRSLQDLRNVLSPHPHIPMLDTSVQPTYVPPVPSQRSPAVSTPPQTPQSSSSSTFPLSSPFTSQGTSQGMTRSRSDSKLLLTTTLSSLAEDEVVSPVSSPLSRQPSTTRNSRAASAAPGMSRSFSADSVTPGSYPARRPSVSSVRRMQHNLAMTPSSQHQASSSISSLASTDSSSSMSLSRSQASSAGLGLDFSSSSRESFDFSDHTSSTMNSPDSSLIINSPITPLSAHASDKADTFDKLFNWQQNEMLQNGLYGSGHYVANVAPPLPFFPTPGMADQMQVSSLSRRNSAANRRRASSLHQPVLETIIGSPVLGAEVELPPMITLKIMTESTNFMLKVAKSASLREVKQKVGIKVKSSGVILDKTFALAVIANASAPSESTAKASRLLNPKASSAVDAAQQQVDLEDEEDWLLAVSLASTKITLRII